MKRDRRYCRDCGRWVFTLVPHANDPHLSTMRERPIFLRRAYRSGVGGGYLCDDCAPPIPDQS